ncbi:acetylornithine deacetylase [Candidatus Puniceispirillum sp.]|uniref:acetylornithine deacetylase n=1 Tax=Candidatus Puniceispirillum sp. TaxID=2026719 RepID=UPI001EC17471|nr:acetylornithine deacetylase [Candidatus Puniceispirillum sp.]
MNQTVNILDDLIGFASVSRDPNRMLIDYVADKLASHGVNPVIIPDESGKKANLYAVTGPNIDGGVMLSGHTDVVPIDGQNWTKPAFTCTHEDGKYYGRGTADMKGFVASSIASFIDATHLELTSPLHLALSYDEEIGCIGVHSLIDMMGKSKYKPAFCIVGEPTEMGLATGHKGKTAIRADCQGREGHSALAPMAMNALHLACDLVSEIRQMQAELALHGQKDDDYNVPYTTMHVGRIEGGIQLNIVPNAAFIDFEIRNLAEDDPIALLASLKERITPIIQAAKKTAPEADIQFTITNTYPGLDTPKEAEIVSFMKLLTGNNSTIKMAFGTEGGLFSRNLGIPTVVCGPGSMDQGHKPDEFVSAEQLAQCDNMLAALNQRLVKGI